MASNRIKGITIEIGANTVKLTDALKETDKELSKTQAALKDVNKLLKLDPKNTEMLKQKQQLLSAAIDETKQKLKIEQDALNQLKASPETEKTIEQQRALEREIASTTSMLKSYESQLKEMPSALKTMADGVGKLADKTKVLSTVCAAAVTAVAGMAVKAGEAADDLNTLANQTGFSTAELQKMKYASDLVDVSVEDMTGSLQKMIKQMASGNGKFKELGVEIQNADGTLRDANTVWYETLEALSQISNETDRDAAAMEIFGRSAASLSGIIDDGGQALKEYGREAENLGLIMSQDTLDAANELNDAIAVTKARLEATFIQTGAKVAETLLPIVEELAEKLASVFEWIASLDSGTIKLVGTILMVGAALSPVLKLVSTALLMMNAANTLMGVASGSAIPSVANAVTSAATAIGISVNALLGWIGLIVAAVGALIAVFTTLKKEAKEAKAVANDVALKEKGYKYVTQSDVQYYDKSDLYTVWNGSGWDNYVKPGAKYDWSAKNDAMQNNTYNFDVNVSQIGDLQDLLNMADTAQLYDRMGVAN